MAKKSNIPIEKDRTIRIAQRRGERDDRKNPQSTEVTADVVGAFGLWKERGLWNLTHIPTGCLLFYVRTKANAVRAVRELQDGLDWDRGDFGAHGSRWVKHKERALQVRTKYRELVNG